MFIKKLLLFGLMFFALPILYGNVFAQQTIQSNQFVTKVGDPQGPPPNTSPLGSGTKTSAPPAPANLRQAIVDKFGVELNGFTDQELNWAWEKFWDISHTNFFNLVKGTKIGRTTGSSGVRECTVEFSYYTDKTLFNVVLLHELGHIMQNNCFATDAQSRYTEHNTVYGNGQNPVTGYGVAKSYAGGVAQSCYDLPANGENYAEMIAYYLNPGVPEMTVANGGIRGCVNKGAVPFQNGSHSDYFNLAQKILGVY